MLFEPAPAKVNLALHLRCRRPDGYHDLETVFAFTAFGDTLHAEADDELSLAIAGDWAVAAGEGSDNLVLRAAVALRQASGHRGGARLHLDKRIPVAAGLGGGSADAAAALRLLNRLWGLGWEMPRLVALAAGLGADVPACVESRACFGSGRGDALAPWPAELAGTPVLLVNPRVPMPTSAVFAGWDGTDRGGIAPGAALADLRNDMTDAAVAIAAPIAAVLARLRSLAGTTLVRMSGSGATCLALFQTADARDQGAAMLGDTSWWMAPTSLL